MLPYTTTCTHSSAPIYCCYYLNTTTAFVSLEGWHRKPQKQGEESSEENKVKITTKGFEKSN
jgi:hypothetical protein